MTAFTLSASSVVGQPLRTLELFAGLGGFAAACAELPCHAEVLAAIDISQQGRAVYAQNFSHVYRIQEIESLTHRQLDQFGADLWWMSPPCQPFTQKGMRRDLDDPRCRGFLHLIDALSVCKPWGIGLENVCGFVGSRAQQRLLAELRELQYHVQSIELCPSQLGWPNRRPRHYLLATQTPLPAWRPLPQMLCSLEELVERDICFDSERGKQLMLSESVLERFWSALDRIELQDVNRGSVAACGEGAILPKRDAITACFASSYGRSTVRAGSYLQCGPGYRRFSPREVARLHGFSDDFRFDGVSDRVAWKLLGNSLSLPALRYVLSHLTGKESIGSQP